MFYVYALLNPNKPGHYQFGDYEFDHEPFYIGKGSGNRYKDYINGRSDKFHEELKAISPKEPITQILFEDDTEESVFDEEYCVIKAVGKRINGGCLINDSDGGDGSATGRIQPEEERKKRSEIRKKWWADNPEAKEKYSLKYTGENNPMWGKPGTGLGRVRTEEERKKQSESMKESYASGKVVHAMLGKHHKEESKQKIGNANRGKVRTEESKEKIRLANIGRIHTEETKEKQSKSLESCTYEVTEPSGIVVTITNLSKYCKERNLLSGSMCMVYQGKRTHHKGYKIKKLSGSHH